MSSSWKLPKDHITLCLELKGALRPTSTSLSDEETEAQRFEMACPKFTKVGKNRAGIRTCVMGSNVKGLSKSPDTVSVTIAGVCQ